MLESIIWNGPVELNGKSYDSYDQAVQVLKGYSGDVCIVLRAKDKPGESTRERGESRKKRNEQRVRYRIRVLRYMTTPPTPTFDFHDRWNGGIPMPESIMEGYIVDETKGMVKMELESDTSSWTGWIIKSAIKEQEEIV